MATVLGINAAFHDPSAALVIDGRIAAAAEEERFTRRKHGKRPVPFSAWELPERAIRWCLDEAGIGPDELSAVAYSYDPHLAPDFEDVTDDRWEGLRTLYTARVPHFLRTTLGTNAPVPVTFVPHHEAHAASAYLAGGLSDCATLVVDGRGEAASSLAGWVHDGSLKSLATTPLPHSLGLLYEELTEHLGFLRSSDEYKIMALASYGRPTGLDDMRSRVRFEEGSFITGSGHWPGVRPSTTPDGRPDPVAAELASSVQHRLEEVLLEAVEWLHDTTGETRLAMAGGVALNCVANSRLFREGPFDEIWIQPAAGDAGTSLGAACRVAELLGDQVEPMSSAALGREWADDEIEEFLEEAEVPYQRPEDIADTVAGLLAGDSVVGWFQGRAEFGPRALGHRSFLAHPGPAANQERLNVIKGREQFRPIAPMVLEERASEIFSGGPVPSPYMLFTHTVDGEWIERIPAAVHVDGTSRAQTVSADMEPLMHRCLATFSDLTDIPVLVNTSFNTRGRPMVDTPAEALECLVSSPVDAVALGPFLVSRSALFG